MRTPENQPLNQATEQLWKSGINTAVSAAEKADYFLKKTHSRLRALTVNTNDIAGNAAEILITTGVALLSTRLSRPLAKACFSGIASFASSRATTQLKDYINENGIPPEVIAWNKVQSDSMLSAQQKSEYNLNVNLHFDLIKKSQQGGLNPTEQTQFDQLKQALFNAEQSAETHFQERKKSHSLPDDMNDLDAFTAMNAAGLNNQAKLNAKDLKDNQALLDKLKNLNLSPEEFKSTHETLQQNFQNQKNNAQAYSEGIAQGQYLADLNQFSSREAIAEQSRAIAQSHSSMMNAMENLSNQQLAIHGATLQHVTYEHGITRRQIQEVGVMLGNKIDQVGLLVGQVSVQVYDLTKFVVAFANEVTTGLKEISAGQKTLGEMIEKSTLILAEAIYQSHQELMGGIQAARNETYQARQEIHMARREIRNMHSDILTMDRRQQAQLKEAFGADYEEIKHKLLTRYEKFGKPASEHAIEIFRSYYDSVILWATRHAKGPTIAGTQAAQYSNDLAMQEKLILLLADPTAFEKNINFWVGYAHFVFGVPFNKPLVNSDAWSEAALLLTTFPKLLSDFAENPVIKNEIGMVRNEGNEILNFIIALKTNPEFFERLLSDYEHAVKEEISEINSVTGVYLKENIIKKTIAYYNDQLKKLGTDKQSVGRFFQNMHSDLLQPKESVGYAWPKDKNPIGFDARYRLLKGKNITYMRSDPLTFDANCWHRSTVKFTCTTDSGKPGPCTDRLGTMAWYRVKKEFFQEHPEVSANAEGFGYRVIEGEIEVTTPHWKKRITGTKASLKEQCRTPDAGTTNSLGVPSVNKESYKAIKEVLEKPLVKIGNDADATLTSLIAQATKRKNQVEAADYQLPFDVFQNISDASPSSWQGELHSLDNYTHFFTPTSSQISSLFTDVFNDFSEKNKEIAKRWLQAELLGLGKIQYLLTSKQNTECSADITYSLEIKFSGKKMSADFTKTFIVYLPNVKTLSDCVIDLPGFLETPCGIVPGNDMYRTWLDYHYREKHQVTSEAFSNADSASLEKISHVAQSAINDELVIHRTAIVKSVIATLSDPHSTTAKKLIYIDATVKKLIAFVSWTYPELLDHPELNRLISALYDKEKIERFILDYQQNPSGPFLHQALENMVMTSLKELKTFILHQVKIAQTYHHEEMLEVSHPLVQDTVGYLNELDRQHFSFGKQKTFSAVEIYRAYRYDDQEAKQKFKEQKINLSVSNKQGNTAAHLAVKFGDIDGLNALLKDMPTESVNSANRHKQSLIDLAMTLEDLTLRENILVALVKKGVTQCSTHYQLCPQSQSPSSLNASTVFAGVSHPVSNETVTCIPNATVGWSSFFRGNGLFNWALQATGNNAPTLQSNVTTKH